MPMLDVSEKFQSRAVYIGKTVTLWVLAERHGSLLRYLERDSTTQTASIGRTRRTMMIVTTDVGTRTIIHEDHLGRLSRHRCLLQGPQQTRVDKTKSSCSMFLAFLALSQWAMRSSEVQ
jgi:hypothetical protein